MKRFWLLALFLAGTLAALSSQAYAKEGSESNSDFMDDVNAGLGSLAQRVGSIEKVLGLKFSGDVRVRYEYWAQTQDNAPVGGPPAAGVIMTDRGRARVRARLAVDKAFGSEFAAGLRIATGSPTEPTSTNQTMTGDGELKPFLLDRAFLTWTPQRFENKVKVTLGRMANPLTFSPITWDDDVCPEGAFVEFTPLKDTKLRGLYFILNENGSKTGATGGAQAEDPFLTVVQLERSFLLGDLDCTATIGYEYMPNVSGFLSAPPGAYTGPGAGFATTAWSVNGNFMVADATKGGLIPNINTADFLFRVKHKLGEEKIPVQWTLHGALNFNSFNITPTTVVATAFKGGAYTASNCVALFGQVAVGKVATGGEWAGSFEMGYIEPNAVLSLFSDSDSGMGYNNQVWLKGTVEVGLFENVSFKVGQYLAWRQNYAVFGNVPSGTYEATTQQPLLRSQIDLVAKL